MSGVSTPSGDGGLRTRFVRLRLSPTDGRVTVLWAASRLSVFIAATYSTWVVAGSTATTFGADADAIPILGPIAAWNQWDLPWYVSIARDGYGAAGFENSYAFMPSFPALLWFFGKLNVHPTLAGMGISLTAGLLAALALSRLTRSAGGRGEFAVLAWILAPAAVYLAAPYTEALFCAFAFWAWHAARQERWLATGMLASAACLARINGLFLACAVVVLFFTNADRRWRSAPTLLLPFATILGIAAWFRITSGSWNTWLQAQSAGWHREFTNPVDTLHATVDFAFNIGLTATYNVQYKLELATMAILIGLTVVMLVKRWWGESTYMILTIASLGTSTLYYSVPRATLVLFPMWILMGTWMARHRSVLVGYVAVAAPLMLIGVAGFVNGRWIA
jgi:hypothetical protein